ncbi:methylmalonyl Co-A mutase-associated GTPase MeaB [Xinfangfangia sp. D13-10-4-6]|uniref:methylmalonyl Co-A mutase-associated GTPase MeaB n=1 Tax=Pseudogemmobacter hezensis TaxID=2737662 RepID=UPI001553F3C1|nr:methylmalonyl Co-A mutase-associated GTPase MeaB [Pseudogemmobacter hezensis]NPD14619.1 methylmalonyl Co-A mutase-associated GTPase MeaB [Pseudogemmobacter hezensis]
MDVDGMAAAILAGDRRALARGITLIESARPDHREQAVTLISALRGAGRQALRLGLSGTPGVGKSTFIEAFGMKLADQGKRIAVLAVDPSSARSGGSILGDKTRMEQLSRHPNAYIRPSPSQAHMGGVARRSREAVALCEAAGFDLVLIETVGVGQSETMVAEICDIFILLMAPAGGDELQGVKRGIMEMADMILVNKADGELLTTATRTVADYAGALRLLRKRAQDPQGFPKAMPVSAYSGAGLDRAWDEISGLADWRREHGHWALRRADQAAHWFREEVRHGLLSVLEREPARGIFQRLAVNVAAGEASPEAAARQMLASLGRG